MLSVPLWAVVAAIGAAAVGWQAWEVKVAHNAVVTETQARQRAEADTKAAQAALVETTRRLEAQEQVVNDAKTRAARDRASAAAADAAAGRLRDQVARLAVRAAGGNPSPADGGPSAADAARMLAELQRSVEERGRRMAEIADERGRAGDACVRLFESLTPP